MKNADKPAYPVSVKLKQGDEQLAIYDSGLSKRETFAMAAMQGILSNSMMVHGSDVYKGQNAEIKRVTDLSKTFADALLEELEQ